MGKILLIASLFITAGATGLGFLNHSKLSAVQAQAAAAELQAQQKATELAKSAKDLGATKETLTTVTAEKDQLAAQADSLKTELTTTKGDLTKAVTDVTAKEAEIARLAAEVTAKEAELAAAKAGTTEAPDSGTPSPEQQAILQEKETLIAKLQSDLDSSRGQLETLRKADNDRRSLKMRNGLEGRILAVNQAWNFVVLNLGDKNGVVSNAEMLIKRGTQLIGKVRVTSVEPSTSIADIVSNSVPRGFNIQPGDNVIYQAVEE